MKKLNREPLVIELEKETVYKLNWIAIRRKINAISQKIKLMFKKKEKVIVTPPKTEIVKPKRTRKPKVKEV